MERKLTSSPFVPFDPSVYLFVTSEGGPGTPPGTGGVHPFEYTNWWDEMLSYYDNCYIHAGLNPAAVYSISGSDAEPFLKKYFTNSFEKFSVGSGKHGIICNEAGQIVKDGVLLRTGENEYLSIWLWPPVEYAIRQSGMDVQGENLTGKMFMYQLAGPKSLEILESVTGESLRDIKFFHFRNSVLAGKDVRILRIGMAGSLAYEVHGKTEDALEVYQAILEAGRPFGIRKLGRHAYRNTHTEGGFPQNTIHFTAGLLDEDYPAFAAERIWGAKPVRFSGSAGDDKTLHTRNPIELGWGKAVRFDHDFIGRDALEKEAAAPARKAATLVWNKEDIIDVWSSIFEEGEPYAMMDPCEDVSMTIGSGELHTDLVMADGKVIGYSSGRMFSPKSREMISLGAVFTDECRLDRDVFVVWGEPGYRQKLIRAKIKAWPYFTENRNENIDVTSI